MSYHDSLELVPSGNYGCDPIEMWNDQKERMGLSGLFREIPEVKFFLNGRGGITAAAHNICIGEGITRYKKI